MNKICIKLLDYQNNIFIVNLQDTYQLDWQKSSEIIQNMVYSQEHGQYLTNYALMLIIMDSWYLQINRDSIYTFVNTTVFTIIITLVSLLPSPNRIIVPFSCYQINKLCRPSEVSSTQGSLETL